MEQGRSLCCEDGFSPLVARLLVLSPSVLIFRVSVEWHRSTSPGNTVLTLFEKRSSTVAVLTSLGCVHHLGGILI